MKAIKLLLLAVLAVTGFQANAQTADEVVDKYVTAMGGKEKLASLNSVKMSGSMNVQGTDIALTITKTHMVGMRLDIDIMGTSNYQLGNTKEGWVFMPIQGMSAPVQMEEDQFKSFSTQLDVQGALFNFKEKGSTVELAGKETIDGSEAYKLKVTYKSGKVSHFFIDTKSNFLVKTSSMVEVNGTEMESANSFSDYKQNADGYWFPYASTNMQGAITFDKIETNVKVDESIYKN